MYKYTYDIKSRSTTQKDAVLLSVARMVRTMECVKDLFINKPGFPMHVHAEVVNYPSK